MVSVSTRIGASADGMLKDEAVEKRHMIPLQEFLDAPTSIYSRKWTIQPWWLISWGLRQLGLLEKHTALGKLPTARYVVIPNVEVGNVFVH